MGKEERKGREGKDTVASLEMFAAGVADRFSDEAGAFVDFFCEVEAEDAWGLLGSK